MEDNVKSLAKVQINNIHCSPLIHQACHFTIEGYHVGQPFAVPVEVLLVIFHFPKQIQFQVGFLNPISVLLDSVTIFLPGHLSLLPPLYVPFLCVSLLRSSLFSCAGLLPPLFDSLHMWMDHFWHSWKSASSSGSFFFPGSNAMGVFQASPLNRAKSAFLKPRLWSPYLPCSLLTECWAPSSYGQLHAISVIWKGSSKMRNLFFWILLCLCDANWKNGSKITPWLYVIATKLSNFLITSVVAKVKWSERTCRQNWEVQLPSNATALLKSNTSQILKCK